MKKITQLHKHLTNKSRVSKKLLFITALSFAFSVNAQLRLVKDINTNGSSSPRGMFEYSGRLFFAASPNGFGTQAVYATDGTNAGTVPITLNSTVGPAALNPQNVLFAEFNSELYFDVRTNSNRVYVVKLLGNNTYTEPGGVMEITAVSQTDDCRFAYAHLYDNKIVYSPLTSISLGIEPYVIDLVTPANNNMLLDIYQGGTPGNPNSSNPLYFKTLSSGILFSAYDPTNGRELWKTDGTAAGTVLFQDINSGAGDSTPDQFNVLGGQLTFVATHNTLGRELFKTNGNTGNLVLIKNIHPSGDSNPTNVKDVGGTLYFSADNGSVGQELWKSDGNNFGTTLIKDINPTGNSNASNFTQVGAHVFFVADNGTNGRELWKTDGTEAGTVLVKDINVGSGSTIFTNLTEYNGKLYFAKDNLELWISDGTDAGTTSIQVGGSPTNLKVFNNELYMALNTNIGLELYAYMDPTLSVDNFNSLETSIALFPNPTSNYFEIETKETLTKVDIYSFQGQNVKSFSHQNQYDISNLSSGMYFVKILANNKEVTKQIIKR